MKYVGGPGTVWWGRGSPEGLAARLENSFALELPTNCWIYRLLRWAPQVGTETRSGTFCLPRPGGEKLVRGGDGGFLSLPPFPSIRASRAEQPGPTGGGV